MRITRIIGRIFAFIGFTVVLGAIVGAFTVSRLLPAHEPLPDKMVLNYDFSAMVSENYQPDELALAMGDTQVSLRILVSAIDRAAKDPRVTGLIADVSDVSLNLAQIEEVRAALARFRAAGKFTMAYADTFGELGPANREYWLASSFETIWMQPLGLIGLTGPSANLPFLHTALSRIGIQPDFMQRHEYKGAAEMFTADDITEPLREDYTQLLGDIQTHIVNDVAAARQLSPTEVRALMDEAPLSAERAKSVKLIDDIKSRSAAIAYVQSKMGEKDGVTDLFTYFFNAPPPPPTTEPTPIDLVYIDGAIVRRKGEVSPMGGATATAEELVLALSAARESDAKALIIRVNSPGGSVTASESIRQAIQDVRDSGKYVVVTMGDTAASGGYWVATAADYIIADPSTITGSIGVFGGKFSVGELAAKVGVNVSTISTGAMSDMWSTTRPFNDVERQRLSAIFDEIYTAFVERVATARKLTPEQVDKLARGRVWSGQRAKEVGLVDEVGGLREAYMVVRKHLELPEDAPLSLTILPEPEPLYVRFLKVFNAYMSAPQWIGAWLQPLGLARAQGPLSYMGPMDVR